MQRRIDPAVPRKGFIPFQIQAKQMGSFAPILEGSKIAKLALKGPKSASFPPPKASSRPQEWMGSRSQSPGGPRSSGG